MSSIPSPDARNPWHRVPGEPPVLIAHRGAPTQQPENSLESFRAALNAGAKIIEMDVRTTADGELVVMHDATIDRVSTGHGAVDALTWAEVRAVRLRTPGAAIASDCRVPRLEDVFTALPNAAMNVDLVAVAAPDVAKVFGWIRTVQNQPGANLRVLLTSADAATQQALGANANANANANATQVMLGMGRDDVLDVLKAAWLRRPPIERLRGRACQMPAHLNVLGINVPLLVGPLPKYLQKMDCALHVWWGTEMVDDEARLAKCAKWGVDGVFTDEVRRLGARRGTGGSETEP